MATTEQPPEELSRLETRVSVGSEGGEAFLTVPKEWCGDLVRVVRVSDYWPELFQPILKNYDCDAAVDGPEVTIEFEHPDFDEPLEVTGVVTDVSMDHRPERMQAVVQLANGSPSEHEPEQYRIEISRDVGSPGWEDSEYTIERDVMDFDAAEEIVEFKNGNMWEEIGTVSAIATKERTQ